MDLRQIAQINTFYRALLSFDCSCYWKLNVPTFSFEDKILNEKSSHSLTGKLYFYLILLFI